MSNDTDPQGPHALVVEDNLPNLQLLSTLLRLDGIQSTRALSAGEAIALLDEGPYQLVLLDLHLGFESGEVVLDEIRRREEACRLPVMALTGSVEAGERERLLAQGFDDYMQKPIEVERFRERVAALLGAGAR